MKTFRRSILSLSLALAVCQPALPCWDYEDPTMYNHFRCVEPLPSIEESNLDESTRFWADYLGIGYSDELKWAVDGIALWQFDDEDTSNLLLTTLRQQQRTEGLEFLRLNLELEKLQSGQNSWDYKKVTPQDYEALLQRIDALKVSDKLTHRKTFLKMRCLYSLKDHQACMRLWDNFASKWEPSPLRNRMEGYVAGIYCRQKQFDKAIPLYFALGDDRSIGYCVSRMLGSTSIEAELRKDPNSPILGYILQDYANYYYHARKNDYWEPGSDNPIWTLVTNDARRNQELALRVVADGKAKDLQMWQSFVGFLQLTDGQAEAAYRSFEAAEKLRGGGVSGQYLRLYKFVAALQCEKKDRKFDKYLLDELHFWKDQDSPATQAQQEVMSTLYTAEMLPHLMEYVASKGDDCLTYIAETAMDPILSKWKMDREMTVEQVIALKQYMERAPQSDLEIFMRSKSVLNDRDYCCFDEFIGTKLMRADRYEEAAEYLALVPQSYIRLQGTSDYLRSRIMPRTPFSRQQYRIPESNPELNNDNYKLDFCRSIVDLKAKSAASQGEEHAQAELELAKRLFQASPGGDLWGLSEYSWSSYGPHRNELSDQAIAHLQEALRTTESYGTQVECYYGLAAIEAPQSEGSYVRYDAEAERWTVYAYGSQLQGYQWLRQQTKRSHPTFHRCDWLKLYVQEYQPELFSED